MHRGVRVGAGVAAAALVAVTAAFLVAPEPERRRVGAEPPTPSAEPTVTESPSPTVDPGPPVLLPDLRSLDAFDFHFVGTGTERVLRFAAALANDGPGPLLLRPRLRGEGCPPGRHPAVQRLHADRDEDGRYRRPVDDLAPGATVVGCMLRHPGHDHWHFDAMARYSLRRAGETEPIAQRRKVSFCLRDNRRVPGTGTTVRREHFGDCTRRSRQGISPGWVDVYPYDLPGQSLPLPPRLDGIQLCLDLEADPLGVLEEVDEEDNGTSLGIVVRDRTVRRTGSAACR
jgi:hypothetical protein